MEFSRVLFVILVSLSPRADERIYDSPKICPNEVMICRSIV